VVVLFLNQSPKKPVTLKLVHQLTNGLLVLGPLVLLTVVVVFKLVKLPAGQLTMINVLQFLNVTVMLLFVQLLNKLVTLKPVNNTSGHSQPGLTVTVTPTCKLVTHNVTYVVLLVVSLEILLLIHSAPVKLTQPTVLYHVLGLWLNQPPFNHVIQLVVLTSIGTLVHSLTVQFNVVVVNKPVLFNVSPSWMTALQ